MGVGSKYGWLLCAAMAVSPANTSIPQSTPTSTLKVLVLDQLGSVISDASITLLSAEKARQAKTDQRGIFDFTGLPAGIYDLKVAHFGFEAKTLENLQVSETEIHPVNITMKVGTPGCGSVPQISYLERRFGPILTADVANLFDGSLRGASVKLISLKTGEQRSATSGTDGSFQFSDIEPGKYELRVEHRGYSSISSVHLWITGENLTRITNLSLAKIGETRIMICE